MFSNLYFDPLSRVIFSSLVSENIPSDSVSNPRQLNKPVSGGRQKDDID